MTIVKIGNLFSDFFRFVTDGSGNPYYFNANTRIKMKDDPDDKNTIIRYFLNGQKCNIYRCHKNELIVEKIEREDDSEQIRAWLNDFVLSDEYQDLCITSVMIKPGALYGMKDPRKNVQLMSVMINGRAIQYIENPSEAVQLAAVKKYGYAIEYIKNPSETVVQYLESL